jgi:hypothetical protein
MFQEIQPAPITSAPVMPAGGFHGTSQATTTEEPPGRLPAVQVPQDEWRQAGPVVVKTKRLAGQG